MGAQPSARRTAFILVDAMALLRMPRDMVAINSSCYADAYNRSTLP